LIEIKRREWNYLFLQILTDRLEIDAGRNSQRPKQGRVTDARKLEEGGRLAGLLVLYHAWRKVKVSGPG
jgi:hypothetical protein